MLGSKTLKGGHTSAPASINFSQDSKTRLATQVRVGNRAEIAMGSNLRNTVYLLRMATFLLLYAFVQLFLMFCQGQVILTYTQIIISEVKHLSWQVRAFDSAETPAFGSKISPATRLSR